MGEILWLGVLFGAGATLSVGPVFILILQEAITRGLTASLKVILGSAVADFVLLFPALAFTWIIATLAEAKFWVASVGAFVFIVLAGLAFRDAHRLWRLRDGLTTSPKGWAFWKGVIANLVNPLTWTFWLASGTPSMLRAQFLEGTMGVVVFTIVWFVVASGMEVALAFVVARSGRQIGPRGQGILTSVSAVVFLALAVMMLWRDVVPALTQTA